MKLTNLEIIKAAAGMGYSATLKKQSKKETFQVVSIIYNEGELVGTVDNEGLTATFFGENLGDSDYCNISGFLYVGHLFGEPVIPEGQRFRVKKTGEIKRVSSHDKLSILLFNGQNQGASLYSFVEIEPVFN